MNTLKYEFIVATPRWSRGYDSVEDLLRAYPTRRFVKDGTRKEMQGLPLLDGFIGPIWEGQVGHHIQIRYEDEASSGRHASVQKIADRHLYAASQAEEAARAIFELGTSPTPDPWHGGKPKIQFSFAGVTLLDKILKKQPEGSTKVAVQLRFGGPRNEGIYAESMLFERYSKLYPEQVLFQVFDQEVRKQGQHLMDEIRKAAPQFLRYDILRVLFPGEASEWEIVPGSVAVSHITRAKNVEWLKPFKRTLLIPYTVTLTATVKELDAVTETPFSNMSDQELNKWIGIFENISPENFWRDGELRLSRLDVYAMYRKQWRAMPAREQVLKKKSLTKYL